MSSFCDEVIDQLEPIAAGDVEPEARIAAHFSSCPNCAAALAAARTVDRLLKARPVPTLPPQFTVRTLTRLRRDRWRREQVLDAGFNIAIGAALCLAIAGIWFLLDRTGLAAVGNDTVEFLGSGVATLVREAAPALPVYLGAMILVATALGIWWWAERDVTF